MMECKSCGSDLEKFLSLGTTPLANRFLTKEELAKEEPKFPLELFFCHNCKLVQLGEIVPPELLFKEYVYVSSTTKSFREHFADLANHLQELFSLSSDSLAIDIGSNDGILLKPYKKLNIPSIGVEPASNVAKIANDTGFETINDFFNAAVVNKIIESKGKADIITAANVFAHVKEINEFLTNIKRLLKKNGVYIIEIQYFVDTVETMTFDNVYHEHIYYYTLTSLESLFNKHNMEIFRVERIKTHGGSLRAFVKHADSIHEKHQSVNELLEYESRIGVTEFNWYEEFATQVYSARDKIVNYIREIRLNNHKIVGYGAPAKGNTLLNFCQITNEDIDYIVEDNALKVGLFTPGTHIPVVSPSTLNDKTPDFILILAWNFADEILEKTKIYKEKGVKFILPLPRPMIV